MLLNQKLSEGVAVADLLAPASVVASTVATGAWVNVNVYRRMMAMIVTGVLGASATVDAKWRQASDSSGTGAKDVTGRAITQILKASGDNKVALLNLNIDDDLDVLNNFAFVQVSITVGTATSIVGCYVLGVPSYETADQFNNAAVTQIAG